MLPLKLLRSLVLGETITKPLLQTQQNHHDQNNDLHHHHDIDDNDNDEDDDVHKETRRRRRRSISKTKTPLLLFLPTKELVTDTYRLATIARDMGMDLYPTPSLSHIVFSYPSSSSSSSSSSWSTSSLLSTSTSLPNDAVPLPFPSLATASLSHLRSFSTLSKGLFKLAFLNSNHEGVGGGGGAATTSKASTDVINSNWNCCSISLFSRLTGDKICTMDGFIRALAGKGWTLFKTKQNPCLDFGNNSRGGVCVGKLVYLFRKVESNRVRVGWVNGDTGSGSGSGGECRVRELRLPHLDFRNAPLRILQYILLMTDDMFYLA